MPQVSLSALKFDQASANFTLATQMVEFALLGSIQANHDREPIFVVRRNKRLTINGQYTYLITIPLIMVYSFGFAYIKYAEGFISIAGEGKPKLSTSVPPTDCLYQCS